MGWSFEEDQEVPGTPHTHGCCKPSSFLNPRENHTRKNKAKQSKTDTPGGQEALEAQPTFREWSDFLGLLPLGFFSSFF